MIIAYAGRRNLHSDEIERGGRHLGASSNVTAWRSLEKRRTSDVETVYISGRQHEAWKREHHG